MTRTGVPGPESPEPGEDSGRNPAGHQDPCTGWGGWAAVVLAAFVLLVRVLTHFPFFDEALRVRFLWLISSGLTPNVDFFFPHPLPGYLLTLPYFRLFPESAFVVLGLRCLSFVLFALMGALFCLHGRRVARDGWMGLVPFLLVAAAQGIGAYFAEYSIDHLSALAAIGAMLVFFTPPRALGAASSTALALLSIAIMPKFVLPLALGWSGYLAALMMKSRRVLPALGAAGGGALAATAAIGLLYLAGHASWLDNFRHSYLLQSRRALDLGNLGYHPGRWPSLLSLLEVMVRDNTALFLVAGLGVAGWVRMAWRSRDAGLLGGLGVLAGALASLLMLGNYLEQYLAPILLGLALFAPFSFCLLGSTRFSRTFRRLLVAGAIVTLAVQAESVVREFRETPFNVRGTSPAYQRMVGMEKGVCPVPNGVHWLARYQELMWMVPPGQRVALVYPYHPIFRRDLTFVTFDDTPSHIDALPPGDPMRAAFDPESFRQALERDPPALISPTRMEFNYPPGWKEVAEEFLSRRGDLYVRWDTGFFQVHARKDLVGASEGVQP